MRVWHRLTRGVVALFARNRHDAELDAELQHFLEASIDAKRAAGMSREAAERAARLELGSAAALKDWTRDAGWESRLESLGRDIRYAVRLLRRSPGFACAAIGTLAVGLGATAAMYAVVDAVLLKPFPYDSPDRVVQIRLHDGAGGNYPLPAGAILAVRGLPAVEYAAASGGAEHTMITADTSLLVSGEAATEEFFQVFGVPAALGRTFSAADAGAGPVVVLSDRLWRRAFGARAGVIGESISMSGVPHRILGVMPADFWFRPGLGADYWVLRPFAPSELVDYGPGRYEAVCRLRTSDLGIARAQVAGLALPIAPTDGGQTLTLALVPMLDAVAEFYGRILWSLLGAVGLVLLLACGNVANLLLARARHRVPELFVREAIGASRGRILGQILTECAVLAAAAAVAGSALAWLLVRAVPLLPVATINVTRIDEVALNGRVYAFMLAITGITALLFGLVPALTASRRSGATPARSFTRRHGRASQALIAVEIAATVALLVGSGLVAVRLTDLMTTDFGFGVHELRIASLRPTGAGYQGERLSGLYAAVIERLAERSGVEAVLVDRVPLDFWRAASARVSTSDAGAATELGAGVRAMSSGALTVLGATIVAGRDLRREDREGAPPVAIVNASLAARLAAGGRSPVGRTVTLAWRDRRHVVEVVGVVNDLRDSVYRPVGPEIYVSAMQFPPARASFVLRSDRSTDALTLALRQAVRDVDPRQAISEVTPLSDRVRTFTALSRFVGILLTIFAGLAVLLAATGVLAVLAGAVASRTREIGIRIAVGATRVDVFACLSREFVPALIAGGAAGLAAAYSLSTVAGWLVPGVAAFHPLAYGGAVAAVVAIAIAGAWWPVRRALAIEPSLVLASPEEW